MSLSRSHRFPDRLRHLQSLIAQTSYQEDRTVMSSSSEDENDSNFAPGISHLPMNPMLDTLRLTSQGPDHDPSLLGMSFPVVKKKKSPKPNTKGGEVEDETKEEDIDPSKLDIKFVDQT